MHANCEDISVIICAYTPDRWDRLADAVESVRRQTLRAAEIIVVIDHNEQLRARAQAEFGDCTVVENHEAAGLSGARNSGVAAASSEIVAFLDDDAVADERWLEQLSEAYRHPSVLGVGGRIDPLWEDERPGWFPPEFDWVIGCSYEGLPECSAPVRNVIGANMSFKRSALLDVGAFSSALGRTLQAPLGCEETDVCIRLAQRFGDGVVRYEPSAVVRHFVPNGRARWSYFWSRCYGEGVSKARLTSSVGSRDGLSSERRHVAKTLPRGVARNARELAAERDPWAAARTAALVGGLGITGVGYVRGRLSGRADDRSAGARGAEETPRHLGDASPAKTRVLVVTPRYLPLVGGVEHHVDQVCRRLPEDIDVTVLTTDTTGGMPADEVIDGVRIHRVRAWPREQDLYVAPAIRNLVRNGHWDLVHVQSYHTAVAPLAMHAARQAGIPYVVTFHGGGHSSRTRTALRGLQWSALRPLLADAAKLIAVADFEAEFFSSRLGIPRERFVVIPNGSDLLAAIDAHADSTTLAEESAVTGRRDRRVIASIGRLEKYKGHHRVVRAMPRVLREEPDVELQIIGSGPYQSEIERTAADLGVEDHVVVRSVPAGDRALMARTLAGLDLVVLMSDFETHPLAVMEALAMGRPVLAADTSGLRELAERGLARTIPLDSDDGTLADAIVEELRHPRTNPPVTLPSWDECAESVLSVYREVLAQPMEQPHVGTSSRLEGA